MKQAANLLRCRAACTQTVAATSASTVGPFSLARFSRIARQADNYDFPRLPDLTSYGLTPQPV